MAATYTDIVGAVSTWGGPPGSIAFEKTVDRLIQARLNRLSPRRTTTIHVRLGTPGAGDGSIENPYEAATMADIRTLFSSFGAADTEWRFKAGDVFYAANSNTDQGIVIAHPNVTITTYSETDGPIPFPNLAPVKPAFCGFKAAYGASGWSASGAGTAQQRTEAVTVYWVRARATGSDYRAFRTLPYQRITGTGAITHVQNNPGTWHQAAGVLYVNPHAGHDIATVEAVVATGSGILVSDPGQDDVYIKHAIIEGWCGGPDVGPQCVRFENRSNRLGLLYDVESYWSTYHNIAQLAPSTGTGTGGILFCARCEAGLPIHTTSGSDVYLGFNNEGGQEIVLEACRAPAGPLQSLNLSGSDLRATRQGTPVYGHTSTGTVGLYVERNCDWTATNSLTQWQSPPAMQDTPTPATRRTWQDLRAFVLGSRGIFESQLCDNSRRVVFIRSNYTFRVNSPSGANTAVFNGNQAWRYTLVACEWIVELMGNWTGKNFAIFQETITDHDNDWFSSAVRIRMGAGATPGGAGFVSAKFVTTGVANMGLFNSVFSCEVGSTAGQVRFGNANPFVTLLGGSSSTAFFGFTASQYSSALNAITLSAAPAAPLSQPRDIPNAMRQSAGALPSAWALIEVDRAGRVRPGGRRSVGALEAQPARHCRLVRAGMPNPEGPFIVMAPVQA